MKSSLKYIERGINIESYNKFENKINYRAVYSCSKKANFPFSNSLLKYDFINKDIFIEVRFKNDRKDYFFASKSLNLTSGDIVTVDVGQGYDIGIVTLLGIQAIQQFRIKKAKKEEIRQVLRKSKSYEIQKWLNLIENEKNTFIKTKEIIKSLNLEMKLNDVEYQADGTKAYFYYTADDRVDFRELIKILAKEFHVRVEMKQIGARQESAKLGGLGPCGRELCCCTWINNFTSVTTNAARTQQLLLNPQRLTGQCTKLKCCLNFEYPVYAEVVKNFPDTSIVLKTKKGEAIHQKSDIFKMLMWYSYTFDKQNLFALSIESVKEIIEMNEKGILPENIENYAKLTSGNVDAEFVVDQQEIKKLGLTDE